MNQAICTKCGAELIPGTSFCRQCGHPATQLASNSEQETAILGQSQDTATTRRFDPRATTPTYEVHSERLAAAQSPSSFSWTKLIGIAVVVAVLVLVAAGVMWSRRAGNQTAGNVQISRSLIYPGSRTIVDMGDNGGAVLHLETPDALDKVAGWYDVNLKPFKTMRIGTTSIIQKRDQTTVTLVTEDNHTSIVIKQSR